MGSRALAIVLVLGCWSNARPFAPPDGPPDAFECFALRNTACNLLTQSGCERGQRCTWVVDNLATPPLGHIGCVPIGSAAVGTSCSYLPPGMCSGYDDCVRGAACVDSACRAICDQTGGPPQCGSGFGCVIVPSVFGPAAGPYAAGVCVPTCDPLADNDFLGSGMTAGSGCSAGSGCYGMPRSTPPTTSFVCEPAGDSSLVHRSACTGSCLADNGCAPGFEPLLVDTIGSQQVDCISLCAPVDCYANNCGSNSANLIGAAPHRCNATDSRGNFDVATGGSAGNNGDQCAFSRNATHSRIPAPARTARPASAASRRRPPACRFTHRRSTSACCIGAARESAAAAAASSPPYPAASPPPGS